MSVLVWRVEASVADLHQLLPWEQHQLVLAGRDALAAAAGYPDLDQIAVP